MIFTHKAIRMAALVFSELIIAMDWPAPARRGQPTVNSAVKTNRARFQRTEMQQNCALPWISSPRTSAWRGGVTCGRHSTAFRCGFVVEPFCLRSTGLCYLHEHYP